MDTPKETTSPIGTGRFIETYEGCSRVFSGVEIFMDMFHDNQFADKRQENLYFPFALCKEWQFALWLLCSRLSLTAINLLLALDILQDILLSFHTGKQLHPQAEVLPSGPAWLCEIMEPECPTKQLIQFFCCRPLECLQSLLSHPLLAQHISFVPCQVWTSAAKICHIYEE
ncbi:hypothetical protein J3R83DRAFT_7187 [Lanmaoa asiatica]|nr:hypothetical protein J3R83DRAFT_7187 [Lanmaoa asiatica]